MFEFVGYLEQDLSGCEPQEEKLEQGRQAAQMPAPHCSLCFSVPLLHRKLLHGLGSERQVKKMSAVRSQQEHAGRYLLEREFERDCLRPCLVLPRKHENVKFCEEILLI